MSSSHVLYIAIILFLGIVIGFVLGRQAATRESADAARRLERRQQRVAELKAGLKKSADSLDAEPPLD